jgi:hypothetical protein
MHMNNSINYGSFYDLLISSDDDYEPYGLSAPSEAPGLEANPSEFESLQASLSGVDIDQWCGE